MSPSVKQSWFTVWCVEKIFWLKEMVSLFPPLVNIYFQGRFGVLTPSPDLCAVCFYPPWFVGLGFFNRSVAGSLTAVLSDIKNLAGKLHIHGLGNFLSLLVLRFLYLFCYFQIFFTGFEWVILLRFHVYSLPTSTAAYNYSFLFHF